MFEDTSRSKVYYDLSQIRRAGEPLRTAGGVSAGAAPLRDLLVGIADVFSRSTADLFPDWRDAMAIDHRIASSVVAGNIRRSARMSIMDWRHPNIFDFVSSKVLAETHWTTNISVGVDAEFFAQAAEGGTTASVVLDNIVNGMLHNGEPGLYNYELASVGETGILTATNPCGEIPLEEFENCNLAHVNLAVCKDMFEACEMFALASRFAYRATFTPDVSEIQQPILTRNRRLGVGFYGLQAWGVRQYHERYSRVAEHRALYAI